MAITTRRVTGTIVLPDGSVPAGGRVIVALSGWDRESGQGVMAGPITILLDEDGVFDADLWCTDTGENGRVYTGLIRWFTGSECRSQNIQFDVPSGAGDLVFAPIWVVGDLPESTQADALAQCLAAAMQAADDRVATSGDRAAVAADRAAVEDLVLSRAVHIYEGAAITNPIVLPYAPANTGLVEVYIGTEGAMIRTSAVDIDGASVTFTETALPPDVDRVEIVVWGAGTLSVSEMPPGSAATPGLPFQGDSDTGIYRHAANQLGISTGGVQRVKISTSAMQIDVPVSGTSVQASASDATSGRLLKVGAFGLGGIAPQLPSEANISDAPGVIAPGIWGYSTLLSHTGGPAGVQAGTLWHARRAASVMSQELIVDFPTSGTGEIWVRSYTSGAWKPWRKMALVVSGATGSRPSAPALGQVYFDTTLNKPVWHNGTGWVDATGATA